jgi:hypothetical protein
VVGVEGFELSTSCSQSKRATGLRHTPNMLILPKPLGSGQSPTEKVPSVHVKTMSCSRPPFRL